MNRAVFVFVFAGLISTVVADAVAEEVCYTPVRGSASTTNVSIFEQLGEYVVLLKRSTFVADTPRFLRLKGELRGIITNFEPVTLDHVLRSGSDLLFTKDDEASLVGVAGPCYAVVSETLNIVDGTGRFEGVTGQITVEGEVFSVQLPSCSEGDPTGFANEFEVVAGEGGICFPVE